MPDINKCYGGCGKDVNCDTFYCQKCWSEQEQEFTETTYQRWVLGKDVIDDWRLLPALKSWLDRNLWLVVVAELILFLIIGYIVWRQIVI